MPSIRLEAIRDGIEDYEALYSLRKLWGENAERFSEISANVNEILSPVYTRLFDNVRLLDESIIPFEKAREIVAKLLIVSKKYGFFVKSIDEKNKAVTFFATGKISCDGGTISKKGDFYVLTVDKEQATINVSGEQITFYAQSKEHPTVYNLEFNWKKTAKKYGIVANAQPILQPYYAMIGDKQKNYKNIGIKSISKEEEKTVKFMIDLKKEFVQVFI